MKKKSESLLEGQEVIHLLREINKGATDESTSLGNLLRLCMRLGKQLDNSELIEWARSETTGYENEHTLPDYRVLDTEVMGNFHGPFGSGIRNTGIPMHLTEKQHHDRLFKAHMMQPVAELEALANASNDSGTLKSNWSADTVAYYQQKEFYTNNMVLSAAWRVLTQYSLEGILDTIRTRVLDFVLQIEMELGVNSALPATQQEVEAPNSGKLTQIVANTIYGGNINLAVGNSGTTHQTSMNVQAGDLSSLKEYLKGLGLEDEAIGDLDRALELDAAESSQPGPATQGWLGRVMIMLGRGTLSVGSNAVGSLIAEAVMRFLGIK